MKKLLIAAAVLLLALALGVAKTWHFGAGFSSQETALKVASLLMGVRGSPPWRICVGDGQGSLLAEGLATDGRTAMLVLPAGALWQIVDANRAGLLSITS